MTSSLIQTSLLKLIKFYQITLSPDHSWLKQSRAYGQCRFYPSCSQYAYDSIVKYGAMKGMGLSLHRVLRCHPFSRGGFDLVE